MAIDPEASKRFEQACSADMPFIETCIKNFRLDGEDLKPEQFIVLRNGGRIVAFGRIKPYGRGIYELGSVGVIEEVRGQGLGKEIVAELIRRFPSDAVYITTDLPSYFERFGFKRIENGPPEIFAKIGRICQSLRTGVVAMELSHPSTRALQMGTCHRA